MNPFRFLTRRRALPRARRPRPQPPTCRPAAEPLEDRCLLSSFNWFDLRPQQRPVYWQTSGPDGNVWFTEAYNDAIGRITPDGNSLADFYVSLGSFPFIITTGPDGNLWFTENHSGKIGQMSPEGYLLHEWSVPAGEGQPYEIAAGPDGNVWFTERNATSGSWIGKITPDGEVTTWMTAGVVGESLTGGSDGNVWFSTYETASVGRITPTGDITYFPIPAKDEFPGSMTAGPDNNIWLCTNDGGSVLKIALDGSAPDGTVLGDFDVAPGTGDITVGSDGNLWVDTVFDGHTIYQLTTDGVVTPVSVDADHLNSGNVLGGPDGNIWLNDVTHNQIGRYNLQDGGSPESGHSGARLPAAGAQLATAEALLGTPSGSSALARKSPVGQMPLSQTSRSQTVDEVFRTAASGQGMLPTLFQPHASQRTQESPLLHGGLGTLPVLEDPLGL